MRMFRFLNSGIRSLHFSLIDIRDQADFTPEEFDQLADLRVGGKLVLDPDGPNLVVEWVS